MNKHNETLESTGLTLDETLRAHRAEQAAMDAQELTEYQARLYFRLTDEQLHRKG